jgi:hypothetical protein
MYKDIYKEVSVINKSVISALKKTISKIEKELK